MQILTSAMFPKFAGSKPNLLRVGANPERGLAKFGHSEDGALVRVLRGWTDGALVMVSRG